MKTLILSAHIDHENAKQWYRLQKQFIEESAHDFEYQVVVNGGNPDDYENVAIHFKERQTHLQCLKSMIEIFKKSDHNNFLVLDSDCWPIRRDWCDILLKLLGYDYLYAAPIRAENFDKFPHPSAVFMKREFLEFADFDFKKTTNLLGIEVSDVGMAMPIQLHKQVWYPLLKTNYLSPHPLYFSIYGDLFYHHCAGSRGLGFRSASYGFYDHLPIKRNHRKIYKEHTARLFRRPRQFINSLRGLTRTPDEFKKTQ